MIDFRYHLVSIVAVFLALAIGIVVGSTALKPAVLTGLQKTATAEKARIDALFAKNAQLNNQLRAAQAYAQAGEHLTLGGLLEGQRVVLVTAPGFPGGVVSGVSTALSQAGATVTGQVQLQSQFFTAGTQSDLDTLNRQLTPAGVTLRSGTQQAQAGELIASAILTKNGPTQPAAGVADATGRSILSGYAAGGFLSISGNPAARATLAVVIIPAAPPTTTGTSSASQTLVTVAQQLNLAGLGTVVAGQLSGSGTGSAIDVMRSGGQSDHFSSVDDADTVIGQIVVAQALYEQMSAGKSGSYGALASAAAAAPSPAPTPAPSSTATATVQQSTAAKHPAAGKHSSAVRAAGPHHLGERPVSRRRGAARSLAGAALAAGAARGAYALLRARPPGGAQTWTRTNHRGEPLTLLEGPAAAAGAALAAALAPGLPGRTRAALVTAAAGAAALGGYDDLAGGGDRRGFRGHLGALAHGEVTTGAVKLGGIGLTGLAASAVLGGSPVDAAVNAGLIAGGANLLNLFDLRPGRAIKVASLAGGLIAVAGARPGARRPRPGSPSARPWRWPARTWGSGPCWATAGPTPSGPRSAPPPRPACRAPAGSPCWPASSRSPPPARKSASPRSSSARRPCTGSTCWAGGPWPPPPPQARPVQARALLARPLLAGPVLAGTAPVRAPRTRPRISLPRRGRQPAPRDQGAGNGDRGRPGAGHSQGAGRRRDRPGRRPHRRDHHRVEHRGLRPPAGLRAHGLRDLPGHRVRDREPGAQHHLRRRPGRRPDQRPDPRAGRAGGPAAGQGTPEPGPAARPRPARSRPRRCPGRSCCSPRSA